jgi:hypothetical protein
LDPAATTNEAVRMIRPSSLFRLAVWSGIALLVRAIVREARAEDPAPLLPPPELAQKARATRGRNARTGRK